MKEFFDELSDCYCTKWRWLLSGGRN